MKKNTLKGKFIVFEGLDGSGQSTQSALLKDFLEDKGFKVILTKEPTKDSEAGKRIKKILHKEIKASPEEIQELMVEDRREHLERVITPALREGKIVVSDRYFFSTFAFGAADGLDLEWLIEINNKFLYPDMTFLLKVSPKICIQRIKDRGEEIALFEREERLTKVWDVYEVLPDRFQNISVIDGEKTIEKVSEEVKQTIKEKLRI